MTAQTATRDRPVHGPANRATDRLIVALDVPDMDEANRLVDELDPLVSFFKLGHWLQLVRGFEGLIDGLVARRKRVFLDTKGSDIPETMREGAAAAASRGVSFLTIHGNGEVTEDAMRAVVTFDGRLLQRRPVLVGLLRDLRGVVVADMRVERGHEHQAAREVLVDARPVRFDARRRRSD